MSVTVQAKPLQAVKVDPACAAAHRHVDCTCTASPMQPVDFKILRHRARLLAMAGLQSMRYAVDPEYKDAVDRVLEVTNAYD